MKYKVNDIVACRVETRASGKKSVVVRDLEGVDPQPELETRLFQIIATHSNQGMESYSILIADDMIGWTVSEWHVIYHKIDKQFSGKKFYELTEQFVFNPKEIKK